MRKVRIYPLLLLIAFTVNAVLPFFAVYNSSPHPTQLSSVFGEKILLCTGDGFKWVSTADLQSGKEKPKPHSGDKCPLCYAARHGVKAVMPLAAALPQNHSGIETISFSVYDTPLISFLSTTPPSVRAPPASFIG